MKEIEPKVIKKKEPIPKEGEEEEEQEKRLRPKSSKKLEERPMTPPKKPFEHIKVKNIEKIIDFLHMSNDKEGERARKK